MGKILTYTVALCLILAASTGGQYRRSGYPDKFEGFGRKAFRRDSTVQVYDNFNRGNLAGWDSTGGVTVDTLDIVYVEDDFDDGNLDGWTPAGGVAIGARDTTLLVYEDFDTSSIAAWTPSGGIDLIQKPGGAETDSVLQVTVDDGGADYIYRTITDCAESWYKLNFYLTDADTSGWADGESIWFAEIKYSENNNGRGIIYIWRVAGELKWRIRYYDDEGGSTYSGYSTQEVSTDTWYSLIWHIKKATAPGANDGICNLQVDEIEDVINIGSWDNDAANYNQLYAGSNASPLDCLYYIDVVNLVTDPELCLGVTVSGGGTDRIEQSIPSYNEYWYSFDLYLTDADTSGIDHGDAIVIADILEDGTTNGQGRIYIIDTENTLYWRIYYHDDAGGAHLTTGGVVNTNTWYNLVWHIKKSTFDGADNGISNLKVNNVEKIAITDWDNDAAVYDMIYTGDWSSDLDAIYYIDNVVLAGERSVCLEVTVSGGGEDHIQRTISSYDEYWLELKVYISDADTSGWDNTEYIVLCYLKNPDNANGQGAIRLYRTAGTLLWRVSHADGGGSNTHVNSTATVSTNTWYNLLWHVKKSTAAGADNGISNLVVNGSEVIAVANWDNDDTNYGEYWAGGIHSTLDAIYYIEDVKLRALVTTYVGSFPTGFTKLDTIPIVEETFGYGVLDGWSTSGTVAIADAWDRTYLDEDFDTGSLAGWTKVGGVALIKNPDGIAPDSVLEVNISGGGTDVIYQAITDRNEYWLSCRFYLTDSDTSGWDDEEYITICQLRDSGITWGRIRLRVVRDGSNLEWQIDGKHDDGGSVSSNSTTTVSTNTWYSLLLHIKKATIGSNGIANLEVNGVANIINYTGWNNDITSYNQFSVSLDASTLDAIYYTDLVKLQGELNLRLKITVVGGGTNNIYQTIPSCDEYWLRMKVLISDADTSGWDNNELLVVTTLRNSGTTNGQGAVRIKRSGGNLVWETYYKNEDGTTSNDITSTVVVTDTWYSLLWRIKKSTAAGADDGFCELRVDGVLVSTLPGWDNDATIYNRLNAGLDASTLNAIYYLDPVVLWSREGLP